MMQKAPEKNKGGRPTKAEALAKGITKSELDTGLKILKRFFPKALLQMIAAAETENLPIDKQFKFSQDIANMYMAMLKADKALLAQASPNEENVGQEPTNGVVFKLV